MAGIQTRWQSKTKRLVSTLRQSNGISRQFAKKTNVKPADVGRVEGVTADRPLHQFILGMHCGGISGPDGVRRMPWISFLQENLRNARLQFSKRPQSPAIDDDDASLGVLLAQNSHQSCVVGIIKVGNHWISDSCKNTHPLSVQLRCEHVAARTLEEVTDVKICCHYS